MKHEAWGMRHEAQRTWSSGEHLLSLRDGAQPLATAGQVAHCPQLRCTHARVHTPSPTHPPTHLHARTHPHARTHTRTPGAAAPDVLRVQGQPHDHRVVCANAIHDVHHLPHVLARGLQPDRAPDQVLHPELIRVLRGGASVHVVGVRTTTTVATVAGHGGGNGWQRWW